MKLKPSIAEEFALGPIRNWQGLLPGEHQVSKTRETASWVRRVPFKTIRKKVNKPA